MNIPFVTYDYGIEQLGLGTMQKKVSLHDRATCWAFFSRLLPRRRREAYTELGPASSGTTKRSRGRERGTKTGAVVVDEKPTERTVRLRQRVQINKLDAQKKRIVGAIKELCPGRKLPTKLAARKRVALLRKRLRILETQILNLELMEDEIEATHLNVGTVSVMKDGSKLLRRMAGPDAADSIGDIMDDVAESMDMATSVQEAAGQRLTSLDDADVSDADLADFFSEFDDEENGIADSATNASPRVPTIAGTESTRPRGDVLHDALPSAPTAARGVLRPPSAVSAAAAPPARATSTPDAGVTGRRIAVAQA